MIYYVIVVFQEVFASHIWILQRIAYNLSTTTEAAFVVWAVVGHRDVVLCPCCSFDISPRCFSECRAESEGFEVWAKGVLGQATLEVPWSSIVSTELWSWDQCENCVLLLTGHLCGGGRYGPHPTNSEGSLSHGLVDPPFPYRNGSVHNNFMIEDIYSREDYVFS